MYRSMAIVSIIVLFLACITTSSKGQTRPRIYTEKGNIHIQSGENGNIVFEPSQQGSVMVGNHVLNVTTTIGPKGSSGIKGDKGDSGAEGSAGVKGDSGQNGTKGEPGKDGIQGTPGIKGVKGTTGDKGDQGVDGIKGMAGGKGEPGLLGPKGSKGDSGDTHYYVDTQVTTITCNASNSGTMRYFTSRLQLCTPTGWRYIAFDDKPSPSDCLFNVPQLNMDAFNAAKFGILLKFNGDSSVVLNGPEAVNISTEILPVNNSLIYNQSVMHQAAHFDGKAYIKLAGVPDNFWQSYNWSVMALMKFGVSSYTGKSEIAVLGHGKPSGNQGFHIGVTDKSPIHGYYSNDLHNTNVKLDLDRWYHITWTSEKNRNVETRCIFVDGKETKCDETAPSYLGKGDTTIGSWWHRLGNDLTLDQLTIVSGVVRYDFDQQTCLAGLMDESRT